MSFLDQVTDMETESVHGSHGVGESGTDEFSKVVSVDVVTAVINQEFRMVDISTQVKHLGVRIGDGQEEVLGLRVEQFTRSVVTQDLDTSSDDGVFCGTVLNFVLEPLFLFISKVTLVGIFFVSPIQGLDLR